MRSRQTDGWTLVGLIVLLVIVFVAMGGIAMAVVEDARATAMNRNLAKAEYLAQAGLMHALYQFRSTGRMTLGEYNADDPALPVSASDDAFTLGGEPADFLLVNMVPVVVPFSEANLCSGPGRRRDRLVGWRIRNVLNSNTPPAGMEVRIVQLSVNWQNPAAGEGPIRLDLNGNNPADWSSPGCAPINPGDPIPIPPDQQVIAPGGQWATNRLWFGNNSMDGKTWIELTFTMASGPPRVVRFVNDLRANDANFTVRSLGLLREDAAPFTTWRRVQAEYRLCANAAATSECDDSSDEQWRRSVALLSYEELEAQTP